MVILPTIVVWPYVEVGPSRLYGHRRIGLSIAATSLIGAAVLSYMGTPWFAVTSSPDQEAVASLLPQTSPGPLRLAPWDELLYGTYEASQWQQAPSTTLRGLLGTFDREMEHVRADQRYRSPEGFMIIEDWQTDLKKVTLRVTWTDGQTGEAGEFFQTQYLHRDSDYGQGE
jgi:hypothetical protein